MLIRAFRRIRKWESGRQSALTLSLAYMIFAVALPTGIFLLFVGLFGDLLASVDSRQISVFMLFYYGAFFAFFWYFGDYED